LGGFNKNMRDNFDPAQSIWFKKAVEANGKIVGILADEKTVTEETIFTYALCIFDNAGYRLGVVCLDLTFKTIDTPPDDIERQSTSVHSPEMPVFDHEILLFEDNEMNQQVICERLQKIGIKTMLADNGQIGVDIVRNRLQNGQMPFDLIFVDIHMPVMDGMEAARRIRALKIPESAQIPIIAMTANVLADEVEKYIAAGINDCVSKPVDLNNLINVLCKYLR
jgi:CheY-like chemotaxis protein